MSSDRPGASKPPVGGSRPAPKETATPPSEAAPTTGAQPESEPTTGAQPESEPAAGTDAPAVDDTRPVSRDWLSGAPEGAPREPAPQEPAPQEAAAPESEAPEAVQQEAVQQPDQEPDAAGDTQVVDTTAGDTQVVDTTTAGETQVVDTTAAPTAQPGDTTEVIDRDAAPGAHPVSERPAGPPTGPPRDGDGDGPGRPWWRRPALLAPAAVVAALGVLYGADLLLAQGEVPRNTSVAGVDVGGLSPAAAATTLEQDLAPRVTAEHLVVADDVEASISPEAAGITLDVPATVEAAGDQPLNPWTRLTSLFTDREVAPVLDGDETALAAQLEGIAAQVDRAPSDATIAIEGTTPAVVEPLDGRTLDQEGAGAAITAALADGGDPDTPIELPVDVEPVDVEADEAQRVLDEIVTPALSAPVEVVSDDGGTSAEVPVSAIAASLRFTPQDDGELAVDVDPAALKEELGDQLGAFGTSAEDATFEVSGGTVDIVPSVDGTGVDPQKLADQLLPVLTEEAPRSVTPVLGPVPAEFTTEDAEALGITEEISSFTTYFTNTSSGTNIRVVAAEVDGAIVEPGETFSLNGFTGPRGLEQGYVEAGVINNGEFTTAVGGGISQFATTMFNAVFFAGLEDVYHKPHSYYISRYPAGREATVYYDSIDLTWRNDSDTGVYIDTNWQPGSLTVTFYGTKRYEIQSISSERFNQRAPVVQEKPDDGDCAPQSGSTGFDITVTRVFRDLESGAEIKREDFRTRYAAEPTIRCVKPKDEGGAAEPSGSAAD